MTSRQESLVEALALNPDLLSAADRAEAENLLEQNSQAATLFVYFQSFYKEFGSGHQTFFSERARQFLEGLLQDNRLIRLAPRKATLSDPDSGSTIRSRLAASSTSLRKKFELLGSSMSSDGETNVRFIKDQDSGSVLVYSISRNQDHVANAMILFEDTGVFLVTDGGGRAEIDVKLFDGLNLLGRTIYLRPLSSEVTIETRDLSEDLSSIPYVNEEVKVKAALSAGTLLLEPESEAHVVLGSLDGSSEWKLIPSGETTSVPGASSKKLFLRIYG